jgi:glycosyltransferase involved in cell wall biosynthesis
VNTPEVFIAVPVFRGQELAPETLRSIRDQTFGDYRVLISIDGGDAASAEACRPFTADPRFSMVVQPGRLGWPGNLNWLIDRCDCPYFCYWQQDDLAATNYLEALRAELLAHPAAAIAYADVQWFGARFGRDSVPGLHGSPARRLLAHVEAIRYEPLRGLMRAEHLPRPDAIPVSGDQSCQEEFVFLAAMAARGEFRRVADTMYFKRAHAKNTFARWLAWPDYRRRRGWIDMGLGFLRVAREAFPASRWRRRLVAAILDRLTLSRPGRGFFYRPADETPAELARFARDLVSRGEIELEPGSASATYDEETSAFFQHFHALADEALSAEEVAAGKRQALAECLREGGELHLDICAGGEGLPLLGFGWSATEGGGVWNDGDEATLWLPPAGPGPWRVVLEGHHYASRERPAGSPCRVEWRVGRGEAYCRETVPAGEVARLELLVEDIRQRRQLYLRFPDSALLADEGVAEDPRRVGFGLRRVGFAQGTG